MELTFVIFSTLCLVLLVFEAARTYRLMARIKQPLIRTQSGEQELSRMKRFKSVAAIQRDLHAYRGLSAEERADSKLILQASDLECSRAACRRCGRHARTSSCGSPAAACRYGRDCVSLFE
jgi:hypothetical protein